MYGTLLYRKNEDLQKALSRALGNAQRPYSRQECSSVFSAHTGQGEPIDIIGDNILQGIPTFHHHIKHHCFILSLPTDAGIAVGQGTNTRRYTKTCH